VTLELSDPELRVLGCLLEKQRTTPDDYPLTANSVMRACNQTSSRDPIVRYETEEVEAVLRGLRQRQLTRVVHSPSNRSAKHRHVLDEVLGIDEAEQAVLCLLALRGPQTPGELKTRSVRLHPFADLSDVQATLEGLAARDEPLVEVLPRRAGHKELRWAHLLGGTRASGPDGGPERGGAWQDEHVPATPRSTSYAPTAREPEPAPAALDHYRSRLTPPSATRPEPAEVERAGTGPSPLEERVAVLEAELERLQAQVTDLRERLKDLLD
jgi:uncharacterized protein YceH (UPF0502 family)